MKLVFSLCLLSVTVMLTGGAKGKVQIFQKSFDQLDSMQQELIQFARTAGQSEEDNDVGDILEKFQSKVWDKNRNRVIIYSKEFQSIQECKPLVRWANLMNLEDKQNLNVPGLYSIYYVPDTKELVAIHERTQGTIFSKFSQMSDVSTTDDNDFFSYVKEFGIRLKMYEKMIHLITALEMVGYKDCRIEERTYHLKADDLTWNSSNEEERTQENGLLYEIYYAGFDSLVPVKSKCNDNGLSDNQYFVDYGQYRAQDGPNAKAQTFSLSLLIYEFEALFWTGYEENNYFVNEEIKFEREEVDCDNNVSPEGVFQDMYLQNIKTEFERNSHFNTETEKIGEVSRIGLLGQAFQSVRPISIGQTISIYQMISGMVYHRNSKKNSEVNISGILTSLDYLGEVFKAGLAESFADLKKYSFDWEENQDPEDGLTILKRIYDGFLDQLKNWMSDDYGQRKGLFDGEKEVMTVLSKYHLLFEFYVQLKNEGQDDQMERRRRLVLV